MIVDHDTGRLVWAAPGRNSATVHAFFEALGPERTAQLTHVSADGAQWIPTPVQARAPQAMLCLDAFHVVAWATEALDATRREVWNELRRTGRPEQAASLKGSRWALVKNPGDLTGAQRTALAAIATTSKGLYRAYLLKEQLRAAFAAKGQHGKTLLAGWISWARRSRKPAFVKLARTIECYRPLIWNTFEHGLSNARVEATNTHLPVLTRRAYGFHTPKPSSLWPASPAVACAHPYPAAPAPDNHKKSPTETAVEPQILATPGEDERLSDADLGIAGGRTPRQGRRAVFDLP